MKNTNKRQVGMTLIEILVAMSIGLVILGATIQLFQSNKMTYRLENSLTELQDKGRFIIQIMTKEIRMAGFYGCSSRGDLDINQMATAPAPYTLDSSNGVNGSEGGFAAGLASWTPVLPAMLNGLVTDSTDTITAQRASECSAPLTANAVSNAGTVDVLGGTCTFAANTPVVITDCKSAEIFQPTAVATVGGSERLTYAGNFDSSYEQDSADVHPIESTTFGIGNSVIDPTDTSLWMTQWTPDGDANMTLAADFNAQEIATGVEDLQILYGTGTGLDPDIDYATTYVTADNVADWSVVRSIRINLLLHSADNVTSTPRSIMFDGQLVNNGAGADNRLRMVFSSTITLRNRLN